MYPKNSASPPRIAIGAVVQISDGAVQSSGCSVVVRPEGGEESAGAGTIAYSAASGVVYYTPTQAETNYTAFCVIAYKTACIPAQVTVVPTASDTAGVSVLDPATQTQLDSIETNVAALSSAGEITISSPVVDLGADGLPVKIEIVQGADYLLADDTEIELTLTGTFPAWTSASAYLDILCGGVELSLTGTITTATGGTRVVYFQLTATQSATLVDATKDTPSQDIGVFDLRVVLSNTHVTYPINRGKFVSRRRSQA